MNMTIEQITAAYPNVAKLESQAGRELLTAVMGQLSALAAEKAGLKAAAEFATAPDMWVEQADGMLDYRYVEWYVDVLKAAMETPATEAVLAEVRSSAIKAALDDCSEFLDRDCIMDTNGISYEDAALREEGAIALRNALLSQGAAL